MTASGDRAFEEVIQLNKFIRVGPWWVGKEEEIPELSLSLSVPHSVRIQGAGRQPSASQEESSC